MVKYCLGIVCLAIIAAHWTAHPSEAFSSAKLRDASRAILYVANSGGDDITVIDIATNRVIGSIQTGPTPHGLVASPDGSRVYVSGETDDDLIAIDTATSRVLWRTQVGDRPNEITISADGRYVYVPIRSSTHADVIDTTTKQRVKSIPVGKAPHNAYRSPDGKLIFVTSMGDEKVTIIDAATQMPVGEIPMPGEPRPAAITKDNKLIYVAITGLHGFVVADIAQRKVIDKVELPPSDIKDVSTYGYTPTHGLDLRPDNTQFWITNSFGNEVEVFSEPSHKQNPGSNDISVVDTSAIREVARIPAGLAPKRLIVVNVPQGMGGPNDDGWRNAARRPPTTDYYLRGGGTLSADTSTFHDKFAKGELTIESVPSFYHALGLRGVSINSSYIKSLDNSSLARIKKALADEQRVLSSLIIDGNLISDDQAVNRSQIEENKRLLRAASYLGAPLVRIKLRTAGGVAGQTVGTERFIAALKEMLPVAKELGIKMAIEDDRSPAETVEGLLHIIKETDPALVGVTVDFEKTESNLYDEVAKLAPFAYDIHAKAYGFDRYGDESTIDYRKALTPLQRSGYGAAISIEFQGNGDPAAGVIKTRDLLVKLWVGTARTGSSSMAITGNK